MHTLLYGLAFLLPAPAQQQPSTPHPVVFVTQVPHAPDFATIGSTFGNHLPGILQVPRGGGLWIRYPNGALRELTAAAGLGESGLQGEGAIAVRDPCIHWDGNRVLFSLLLGAPGLSGVSDATWQLYEIAGLGAGDTPVATRVPFQPEGYNNISPAYASDDRILFTTDRPRDGGAHLYPQLDEYEMAPTVSGVWSLNPSIGDLFQLTASPSGDFTPLVDSFGRVLFTRWDHLERDQILDTDKALGTNFFGTFDVASEAPGAPVLPTTDEVFPEPRIGSVDLANFPHVNGHTLNQFLPWMIGQDGSGLETLNHVGRHELNFYFNRTFYNDPNLDEFLLQSAGSANPNRIQSLFQIAEDPLVPGRYFGVEAPEFDTHTSGQLVSLYLPPDADPDDLVVEFITHPDTASGGPVPGPGHTGHYRDPLPLSDGTLIAAHANTTELEPRVNGCGAPPSIYDFRLRTILPGPGGFSESGQDLTGGIVESVQWYCAGSIRSYSGPMWELQPVEVIPRPRPATSAKPIPSFEQAALNQAGVSLDVLRNWLYQNGLALLVSRNVTRRDDADRQQPFNLSVPGGVQSIAESGKQYEVSHLQFFQGEFRRGFSQGEGRRVLATAMSDTTEFLPAVPGAPPGSVRVSSDGSVAAFVPARRPLTWQLTDPAGEAVVRERFWLSFQPGEVVSCASCHGANDRDQLGQLEPTNVPEALVELLDHWKNLPAQTPSLAGPILGPASAGTVGLASGLPGAPFDIVSINGSAGGAERRVDVSTGQPFTFEVATPPGASSPGFFLLWGFVGVPGDLNVFDTFLGSFAFPPEFLAPAVPGFYLAGSGLTGVPSVFPPGLPFPLTVTYQGVVIDATSPTEPLAITNAIVLNVE